MADIVAQSAASAPANTFFTNAKAELVKLHRILQVAGFSVGTMLSTMPSVPTVQRVGGFVVLGLATASAGVEAAITALK